MNFFLNKAHQKSIILIMAGIAILISNIFFQRENNIAPMIGSFMLTIGILLQGMISLACYLKDEPVEKKD